MTREWNAQIVRCDNGYEVVFNDGLTDTQCNVYPNTDGCKGFITLLWDVVEHFAEGGSRYDKERISITTQRGDKYEPRTMTIIGDDGDKEVLCKHGVGHCRGIHTCDSAKCCKEAIKKFDKLKK